MVMKMCFFLKKNCLIGALSESWQENTTELYKCKPIHSNERNKIYWTESPGANFVHNWVDLTNKRK